MTTEAKAPEAEYLRGYADGLHDGYATADAGLLAALEFYADPEMWTPHKDANAPIEMDDGKIARAAIARAAIAAAKGS